MSNANTVQWNVQVTDRSEEEGRWVISIHNKNTGVEWDREYAETEEEADAMRLEAEHHCALMKVAVMLVWKGDLQKAADSLAEFEKAFETGGDMGAALEWLSSKETPIVN